MSETKLQKAWRSLPENANEPTIASDLINPILNELGFNQFERLQQCPTGKGKQKVDFGARKQTPEEKPFIETGKHPELIIELKKRPLDLGYDSVSYKSTVAQLQRYLAPSAKNNKHVKWGIITNGDNIQLFRKHGKIVYPYLINSRINADNIDEKINLIKYHIQNPKKALSIAIYKRLFVN